MVLDAQVLLALGLESWMVTPLHCPRSTMKHRSYHHPSEEVVAVEEGEGDDQLDQLAVYNLEVAEEEVVLVFSIFLSDLL